MKNYYEILNIDQKASEQELKRAYFKQVKIQTPEKDPEGFKLLRIAYETLKDKTKRNEYDKKIDVPSHFANQLFEAQTLLEQYQYDNAIKQLQQLFAQFPEEPQLAIALGNAFIAKGNTGKGVTHFEKMASQFPKDQDVQLALANAYKERGFVNKAFVQYETALSLNRKNPVAWHASLSFRAEEYYYAVFDFFEEAMKIDESMFVKQEFSAYLIAIRTLFNRNHYNEDTVYYEKMVHYFKLYLKGMRLYGEIPSDDYVTVLNLAYNLEDKNGILLNHQDLIYFQRKKHEFFNEDPQVLEKVNLLEKAVKLDLFFDDSRLSPCIKNIISIHFYEFEEDSPLEETLFKFIPLYEKRQFLTNVSAYESEIEFLKKEYAFAYEMEENFFKRALNPLQKDGIYRKIQSEWLKFKKKNPQLAEQMPHIIFQAERKRRKDAMTYNAQSASISQQRKSEKIGRNDPCSCGSGKKYKRCCG